MNDEPQELVALTGLSATILGSQCPRAVLDRVTNRWAVMIFDALSEGPYRFSALTARVAGISPKMLSENLKAMVRAGLIERSVAPTVPPQVTYSLTVLGADLASVLRILLRWIDDHTDTMLEARTRYDTESSASDPVRSGGVSAASQRRM